MPDTNGHHESGLQAWLIARAARELNIAESEIDPTARITTLGIDSLALITIAGELAEFTNRELQAELLWQYDSIASLARHLESVGSVESNKRTRTAPEGSALTILRRSGNLGPAVSVGFQNVAVLLRESLPADVPVWWLPLDGLYQPPLVIRPVPEMAAAFADELKANESDGPFMLVGYSFGGLIALDLACQLVDRGCDVRLLLLEPARFPRSGPENWTSKLRRHRQALGSLSWSERAQYARSRLQSMRERRQFRRRLPGLVARINAGEDVPPDEKWQAYQKEIVKVLWGYHPPGFSGSVALAGRPEWMEKHVPLWSGLVTGTTKLIPLPQTTVHEQIVATDVATPWLEVVEQWAREGRPVAAGTR